jgi:proliferating cell nuclear antigen
MFEAKLSRGATLKKVVEAIKELCKEVNLDCGEKGIQLQAMDSSHVSLVSLHMKESVFETYRADKLKVLGVSMESLAKIFKICGNDDAVTLRCEDESDQVSFVFESEHDDRISDFALKLLDIESEQLGIPEGMQYPCIAKMPAVEFQKICRDLKEFGDSIRISCNKDGVKFTVEGDIGTGNVQVKPRDSEKDEEKVVLTCEDTVDATFAIRYLNFFTKATPLADTVILSIANDQPLVVEYGLGKKGEDCGSLRFFLAPKIEE